MKRKRLKLTGQRFGRLTVTKRVKSNKYGQIGWECVCDCGRIKVVIGAHLKSGHTKSCGCLGSGGQLPHGEGAFNAIFRNYRRGAKARGYGFSLTKKAFRSLTKQNCHYCGQVPARKKKKATYNGGYIFNGVDRVNNKKGYTPSNTVTCCWVCNRMKRTMSEKEFITHTQKVVRYQAKMRESK